MEMTDRQYSTQPPLFIPYPHLVSAMDQYYGLTTALKKEKNKPDIQKPFELKQKKNMKILITTFWNYPFVGGLQNYITALKSGLESLGHIVHIAAPNHFENDGIDGMRQTIMKDVKQFFVKRYGSFSEKIIQNVWQMHRYEWMLKCVDISKYDIIHAQDRFTANVMCQLNEGYQKPLLFTPHGFMTHTRLKFNLIEKGSAEEAYFLAIDQKAVQSSTHIISLCEYFRPLLNSLGTEETKLTTVYTGIDFGISHPGKSKKTADKTIITCISRLRPRKGHKYLFEALSLIRNKLENVEIWIVGEGSMREELERQCQDLQLENVYFLGKRKDIPKILKRSDIFVLPTTSDTLPISVIEAMFARKAIITTNCGGIPEIIQDNHSGLIAEPGNSQQLAEKLTILLDDSILRNSLAQNAKCFAEKHLTIASMARKIEEVYQSFLQRGEMQ
ncbi:glycosyltransferase family 4 protein [Fictibacillus sp. WQ 8-8]|uniref:glycosyltransferase family 4 protein n=1 Tax=Fictibacillus sp. WQ 8-8 TaxID=2938788 RepID=UPI00210A9373|nr:glycosyltransferase family 4 protein [Fictibacillus sp. WQ 8-8]MCQ6264249.1 glycosyltransferase family 4 protein [Fictibacillus sp. WQ 8-8]